MHIASTVKLGSNALLAAFLLTACSANQMSLSRWAGATVPLSAKTGPLTAAQTKTESVQGEFIGDPIDCDGDGITDDARIDFDGDGVSDECVDGVGAIPEPPFQQSYIPTREVFNRLLPVVGWKANYQCGDEGLYNVNLSRTSDRQLEYSADGLTLTSEIVYDDLDPNLNHPLIVQDPEAGIRYAFTQQTGEEFYEYAIADYDGDVGLYVYQTGQQIIAAPCTLADQTPQPQTPQPQTPQQ